MDRLGTMWALENHQFTRCAQCEVCVPPCDRCKVTRWLLQALKKGVIRAEFDKASDKVGDLPEGATMEALEARQLPDGQWRIRIEVEMMKGWVSLQSAKGSQLLELVSGPGY